jgi:hypothetical protein
LAAGTSTTDSRSTSLNQKAAFRLPFLLAETKFYETRHQVVTTDPASHVRELLRESPGGDNSTYGGGMSHVASSTHI